MNADGVVGILDQRPAILRGIGRLLLHELHAVAGVRLELHGHVGLGVRDGHAAVALIFKIPELRGVEVVTSLQRNVRAGGVRDIGLQAVLRLGLDLARGGSLNGRVAPSRPHAAPFGGGGCLCPGLQVQLGVEPAVGLAADILRILRNIAGRTELDAGNIVGIATFIPAIICARAGIIRRIGSGLERMEGGQATDQSVLRRIRLAVVPANESQERAALIAGAVMPHDISCIRSANGRNTVAGRRADLIPLIKLMRACIRRKVRDGIDVLRLMRLAVGLGRHVLIAVHRARFALALGVAGGDGVAPIGAGGVVD